MTINRYLYRAGQFFAALNPVLTDREWEVAQCILNSSQIEIFIQMQASEQKHSFRVLECLQSVNGQLEQPGRDDLMVAALLHDAGKSRYPLRLWERVMIVLAKSLFPDVVRRWGRGEPCGWRRAFVVAERHPEWGAQMVKDTNASPLTVELIRKHQNPLPSKTVTIEDRLLSELQMADSRS